MNKTEAIAEKKPAKVITITVNAKAVEMEKGKVTGLEIKQAAIAQGVNIQTDFVLFEDLGQGQRRVIGDNDVVNVHPGSSFEAIPHDDNS
jgi:hypothetical protein